MTATSTTFIITWIVTGNISAGIAVGGVEFFAKMFLYYGHERAWYRFAPVVVNSEGETDD